VPDWSSDPHLQSVTPLLLSNQAVMNYKASRDMLAITSFPANYSTMVVKGFVLDDVNIVGKNFNVRAV
jgi:hypothetical protein